VAATLSRLWPLAAKNIHAPALELSLSSDASESDVYQFHRIHEANQYLMTLMALVIYSYGEITHAPWRKYPPYPMPTWTGNFLQTYKVYREERIRIRNSEIDCRMRIYDNLQYQSIVIGFSGF